MRISVAPRGAQAWVGLALRWALILALLIGTMLFVTRMPGKSHQGPLAPLSATETAVRDGLRAHVRYLAGTIGERNLWRYDALEAAAAHIETTFRDLDLAPESQRFEVRGRTVRNIAVEIPGGAQAGELVVVGAHYDTVPGSPGANDNGTGVAALLELARLLRHRPLARTLRLVAFVNEEMPFYRSAEMGSVRYARRARERGEHITAMISLETIGHYSDAPGSQHYPGAFGLFYPDTANFIAFVSNLRSHALVRRAVGAFRRHAAFPSEGVAAPGWMVGIGWSDHWAFWEAGYPAIMVTDTAPFRYPHYHDAGDTPERVDYDRTARVTVGLAGVIQNLCAVAQR